MSDKETPPATPGAPSPAPRSAPKSSSGHKEHRHPRKQSSTAVPELPGSGGNSSAGPWVSSKSGAGALRTPSPRTMSMGGAKSHSHSDSRDSTSQNSLRIVLTIPATDDDGQQRHQHQHHGEQQHEQGGGEGAVVLPDGLVVDAANKMSTLHAKNTRPKRSDTTHTPPASVLNHLRSLMMAQGAAASGVDSPSPSPSASVTNLGGAGVVVVAGTPSPAPEVAAGASGARGRGRTESAVLRWVDYEERYKEVMDGGLEECLRVPEGPGVDFEVERVPRPRRTMVPALQAKPSPLDARKNVLAVLAALEGDLVVVERKFERYGTMLSGASSSGLLAQAGELFAARKSPSTPTNAVLPPPAASSQQADEASNNTSDSSSLGPTLPPVSAVTSTPRLSAVKPRTDSQSSTAAALQEYKFLRHQRMTLAATFKSFRLTIGEVEPLFCTAALYDVAKRTKMTEDFRFHMNTAGCLAMAGLEEFAALGGSHVVRSASFNIPGASKDLCLVIKAHRVLRGADLEKDLLAAAKSKIDLVQVKKELHDWVAHGGAQSEVPLQPYLWAPLFLFATSGGAGPKLVKMHRCDAVVPVRGVLTDETIYEYLSDYQGVEDASERLRRLKTVSGLVEVDVTPDHCDSAAFTRLDRSLLPVSVQQSAVHQTTPRDGKVLKELQDMAAPPSPQDEYVNTLYVFPETLTVKSPGRSNLQVSVQLVKGLSPPAAIESCFPASYTWKSSEVPAHPKLLKEAFSAVQCGERRPLFGDEFKLALPPSVSSDLFLLFTFYDVVPSNKTPRVAVGYSCMPLCKDPSTGSVLRSDRHYLPVCKTVQEICAGAGKPLSVSEFKQAKHAFVFRTKLISSIVSEDEATMSLLCRLSGAISPTAASLLSCVDEASASELSRFFNTLVQLLLYEMCRMESDSGVRQTFLALMEMLAKVFSLPLHQGTEGESGMLKVFAQSIFDPAAIPPRKCDGKKLHELLVTHWLYLLDEEHRNPAEIDYLKNVDGPFTWWLLELITKDMFFHLHTSGFVRHLRADMCALATELLKGYAGLLMDTDARRPMPLFGNIKGVASFINVLLSTVDRGAVLESLHQYFSTTDPLNQDPIVVNTVKLPVLRVLADHEHFVPLNIAVPFPPSSLDNVSALEAIFWKRYPLAGLVLNQTQLCLLQSNSSTRVPGVRLLRDLLAKHAGDDRYKSPEIQGRISAMYFPLLLTLLSNQDLLDSLALAHQHEILQCLVYVLKWVPVDLIKAWWSKDAPRRHIAFFELLSRCFTVFEDQGLLMQQTTELSCQFVLAFVADRRDAMRSQKDGTFEAIFALVIQAFALASDRLPSLLFRVVDALSSLVSTLPQHFFEGTSSCAATLSYEILKYTNAHPISDRDMTGKMSSLLFLMLSKNFELCGDVRRMKVQSTVAASTLVGEEGIDTEKLINFVKSVEDRASSSDLPGEFRKGVVEVTSRITSMLNYHFKISNTSDHDALADLFYETALRYDDAPDLRLTWLNSLAAKHELCGFLDEAAQCKVIAALLVSKYLASVCHAQILESDFALLTPSATDASANCLTRLDVQSALKGGGQFQSSLWSVDSLVELIQSAASLLDTAGCFELSVELYSFLATLFKRERDYLRASQFLTDCATRCGSIAAKERERGPRAFCKYFRVAFHGRALGEDLNGKEFIYKRSPDSNLGIVQQLLRKYLQGKLGDADDSRVVQLPNKAFEADKLEQNKAHYQLVSVEPLVGDLKASGAGIASSKKGSGFERHFGVRRFIAAQAFSEEGKKAQTESLKDQRKKKTVFEVEASFPFVRTRLPVISKQELVLEPIDTAIELVQERCEKLREQLETSPPRVNALQQLLQGSVAPMVNEGPLRICETFLASDGGEGLGTQVQRSQLARLMGDFVELCSACLTLDNMVVGPKQLKFHEMLEKAFHSMYDLMLQFLRPYGISPKSSFTKEDLDRKAWRTSAPTS